MKYEQVNKLAEKHGVIFSPAQLSSVLEFDGDEITLSDIVNEAIKQEREACAKLCEESDRYRGSYFAEKIRNRKD